MKQYEADQIESMYIHYHYKCFVCGKPATQRAHIITNSVSNRRQYKASIAYPLNWLPACDLYCNGLIDIGKNTNLINKLIEIYSNAKMPEELKRANIEQIVRYNVMRKQGRK